MPITEQARAKINLTLRVLGRRSDGYHEIQSLVTFAGVGDRVTLEVGAETALLTKGPLACAVTGPNILEKAVALMRQGDRDIRLGTVTLEKNLPVAAGLGGGSSDAAALLRLARRINVGRPERWWGELAERLGADVPVCLADRPAVVEGVGEQVQLLPGGLPPLFAVLANPGVPLETARVFAALAAGPVTAHLHRHDPIGPFASVAALLDYMRTQGNDLERPAVALVPRIAEIKAALLAQPGCSIALMSGSGPTCSGIFGTAMQADAAAAALHRAEPGWWIAATRLAGTLREGTG